ncbi:MAG TPA: hypothetical protein VGJ20_15630 [Xanthobacteraceae bacterium]
MRDRYAGRAIHEEGRFLALCDGSRPVRRPCTALRFCGSAADGEIFLVRDRDKGAQRLELNCRRKKEQALSERVQPKRRRRSQRTGFETETANIEGELSMKVTAIIAMVAAFAVGSSAPAMAQYGGDSGPAAGGGGALHRTAPVGRVAPITGTQRITPNQAQRIVPNQAQRIMPNQAQRIIPNQTQNTQSIIANPNASGRY